MKLRAAIKTTLNKNLNPFYRDVKYLANVEAIIQELNKHETSIIEEHEKFIEMNRVLKDESILDNQELIDDVKKFIYTNEKWSYLKDDIDYVRIERKTFINGAIKLNKDVLFTIRNERGLLSIVTDLQVIDYVFRESLYSLCEVSSDVGLPNVYYYDKGELKKISKLFTGMLKDLKEEYKDVPIDELKINKAAFYSKYTTKYLDYLGDNILGAKHFKIM